ncbi:hypothetical protein PO883_28215 [Massilia sp. DJPM01]|nr:hypothetical protein [Massilia sp. DJPM01]MDM5181073.1 hypothetical protein [Massilia sp. DJPM01]
MRRVRNAFRHAGPNGGLSETHFAATAAKLAVRSLRALAQPLQ